MPIRPGSHLPQQDLADSRTAKKNKVNPTQVRDQMPRPVLSQPAEKSSDTDWSINDWWASSGKEKRFFHFLVFVQLIHRMTQTDISCTTTGRFFFFPLLVDEWWLTYLWNSHRTSITSSAAGRGMIWGEMGMSPVSRLKKGPQRRLLQLDTMRSCWSFTAVLHEWMNRSLQSCCECCDALLLHKKCSKIAVLSGTSSLLRFFLDLCV